MKALLTWWEGCCLASKFLRFIDCNLRGIGQVMFQDNPLSGLLFFVAIGWGSYEPGMPQVAIGGFVAVVTGALASAWMPCVRCSMAAIPRIWWPDAGGPARAALALLGCTISIGTGYRFVTPQ